MKRILHLSDLHFGRDRPELLAPLIDTINGSGADVIALSGDLTQRARHSQFRAARAFIDRIELPIIVVPGNHDIPLHRPFLRMFKPFSRYRHWIDRNLEPQLVTKNVGVFGLNTVTRWSWQRGRMTGHATRRLCRMFGDGDADRINVIVAHHPFRHPPGSSKDGMIGAESAMEKLSECGAHILLSGHLHSWWTEPYKTNSGQSNILQIHAGTGLSTRLRDQDNDFALLDIDGRDLRVERWVALPETDQFVHRLTTDFTLGETGWQRTGGQTYSVAN